MPACAGPPALRSALLASRASLSLRHGFRIITGVPQQASSSRVHSSSLCSCSSSPPSPDAIIVPAGGLLPDGELPEWVKRRLDLAAAAYRQAPPARRPFVLASGGGTPHKPPVTTANGYVVHEGTACAKHLLQAGVPASALLKEVRPRPPLVLRRQIPCHF